MLDLATAALFAVSLSVLQTIVTYLFTRLARTYKGAKLWATASGLAIVGTTLYGLRGKVPDIASVVFANAINLLALWCLYYGVRQFLKITTPSYVPRLLFALPFLTIPLLFYFDDNGVARSTIMTVLTILFMGATAHLSLVQSPAKTRLSHRFAGFVFLLFGAFNIVRMLPFVVFDVTEPLETDLILIVPLLGASIFGLLWTAGIGLMLNEQLVADLQHTATHDFLTNTLNRRAVQGLLEQEFQNARQHATPLSVMLLDVDHFKTVNDEYGHVVGDMVLVELVRRLLQAGIPQAPIARWGGEEFLLILPRTSASDAHGSAERLRAIIAESPCVAENNDIACTVSIGVATTNATVPDLTTLLRYADHALYRAKRAGRNTVRAYAPHDNPHP